MFVLKLQFGKENECDETPLMGPDMLLDYCLVINDNDYRDIMICHETQKLYISYCSDT